MTTTQQHYGLKTFRYHWDANDGMHFWRTVSSVQTFSLKIAWSD